MARPLTCKPKRGPMDTTSIQPEVKLFLTYSASECGHSENTILAYRRDLEHAERYLRAEGQTLLCNESRYFCAYFQSLVQRGQSTATARRRFATITHFIKFIGGIGHDRTILRHQIDRAKKPLPLPKVLNHREVVRVLEAPDPGSPLYKRDVAILEMFYATGVRVSELCGIKVGDLKFDSGHVRVFGKGRKERLVPVHRTAIEAVRRYMAEDRPKVNRDGIDRLFLSRNGKPMDRIGIYYFTQKYGAKVKARHPITPHMFRHCCASHLLDGGANLRVIQEIMGHSDINTTMIYLYVSPARLRDVHRKFHPRA